MSVNHGQAYTGFRSQGCANNTGAAKWRHLPRPLCAASLAVFLGSVLLPVPLSAQYKKIEKSESELHQSSPRAASELARKAERWNLSETEYKRYLQLMRSERGLWSPGLDPLTALGVSAESGAERRRYAELFVAKEYERSRKELEFQRAVDAAWKRLYPDIGRLSQRTLRGLGHHRRVQRYALVVRPGCERCDALLDEQLAGFIESAPEGVDVYVAGLAGDDLALRDWVAQRTDLLGAIKRGRVTVNHGAGFESQVELPLVYGKSGEGQWSEH